MSASEESEKALTEAADILQVRMQEKIKKVENEIQDIDHKLEKQLAMLSENRKGDIENEKIVLKGRLDNLKLLEVNDTVYAHAQKETQQAKRKIADVIDSKRIKRRKLGAGAPSLLDSEDEEFIANAISSKSTCHCRRHETTLFTNHRVKKRDFLSLANYSHLSRGEKLIKSATMVTNRGKPRNVRSRAAKSHKGKWLWCTKKPPKTEDHNTECTHHQRAHFHNANLTMFAEDEKEHSVFIRMDDKAYLCPGTDVGARNTKAAVIYDTCDLEKQKQLPQHDFNIPKVNQMPASFRFIKQHIEKIEGNTELITDQDQSVVTIRPKHYIGSSGSVWASDYMRLYHELPSLFQENPTNTDCSIKRQRLAIHSHDALFYFADLTMKDNVVRATSQPDCKHFCHEAEKLTWLQNQIDEIIVAWKETPQVVDKSELVLASELLKDLISIKENAATVQKEMLLHIQEGNWWTVTEDILKACEVYLKKLVPLKYPNNCCSIRKATDAGPGVGVTNTEVRFRYIETV